MVNLTRSAFNSQHAYFKSYHACLSFSCQLVPHTLSWIFTLSPEIGSKISTGLCTTVIKTLLYPSHSPLLCYFLTAAGCRMHLQSHGFGFHFQVCCWISIRKVSNTPRPSISPSVWLRLTLKLQCLLPHWLQCKFSLQWQMEHWSNHNHSSFYNEQLFPNSLTTSHELSQLLSTGFSFTQKMLLAILLNIFHSLILQLIPSSCSKFLILASSAHNDSFQHICWIFCMYLSHAHDLEEEYQKLSTQTYSRNGPFKSFLLWKLQWELQFLFY